MIDFASSVSREGRPQCLTTLGELVLQGDVASAGRIRDRFLCLVGSLILEPAVDAEA